MKQAVVQHGSKQFVVEAGSTIKVDVRPEKVGDKVVLDHVVMTMDDGAIDVAAKPKITATVVDHMLGEKIEIFKHHAKKRYRRHIGHRQQYTLLRVDKIESAK